MDLRFATESQTSAATLVPLHDFADTITGNIKRKWGPGLRINSATVELVSVTGNHLLIKILVSYGGHPFFDTASGTCTPPYDTVYLQHVMEPPRKGRTSGTC